MLTSRTVIALMSFVFTLACVPFELLKAQDAAVTFLGIVHSARANGMGSCVVTMVSEESAYYNPASAGLLHLDKTVAFVAPHSTKWLPETADDLRLKSWSASVCVSRKPFQKQDPKEANFSVGLAYSYATLNYGMFESINENGTAIGQFEAYDAVKCLTVGLGYRHKVRVGLGYAIKFIESHLAPQGAGAEAGSGSADGTAHQLGLIAELPFHELAAGDRSSDQTTAGRTELQATPTFAYVLDNLGKDLNYADAAQSDKLPRLSRLGFSLPLAIVSDGKEYCSFRGVMEWEKLQVDDVPILEKKGLEVGILRALFLRIGQFDTYGAPGQLSTYGAGFRLRGLLNGGRQFNETNDNGDFGVYLKQHVDLAVDYARYGNPKDNNYSKTWFYAISVSL